MAIGSVISDIQSVTTLGLFTFRPAVGVEALIKGASGGILIGTPPYKAPDIQLNLKKVGVDVIVILKSDNTPFQIFTVNVLLNNDFEIELHNQNASTQYVGFWGIQTK